MSDLTKLAPYIINERPYSLHHPLAQELNTRDQDSLLFDANYLGILQVSGDKSRELLQGQLSCDMNKVNEMVAAQSVYCNIKGRILTQMNVIQLTDNSFALIMPTDALERCQKVLNRYAMLSRVKLSINEDYQIFGFQQGNQSLTNIEKSKQIKLSNDLKLVLIPSNKADELWQHYQQLNQVRGSLAWHFINLKQSLFTLYPSTQLQFLPHRLDLHLTDVIDFEKGCYLGQEIIARTQYRAKLKHALFSYQVTLSTQPEPGMAIIEESREIGQVVDFCPISETSYLILASLLKEHPKYVTINQQEVEFKSITV